MGRIRYTEQERIRITAAFLNCTREIIDAEGIGGVTIRKVAQCAGFNSATLYLYFKDIDELVTLTCIGYLEDYFRSLSDNLPKSSEPRQRYRNAWTVFGKLAFAHPEIFLHLFFKPHSLPLSQTLARYNHLTSSHPSCSGVPNLLLDGDLQDWNLHLMRPLADQIGLTDSEVRITNDLMLCYFKKMLEELAAEEGAPDPDTQMARMHALGTFLLPVRN